MATNLTSATSLIAERLPTSSRWPILGTEMIWTFSATWQRVDVEVFGLGEEASVAAQSLLVFGERGHDGGASSLLALHETRGTVHEVDADRGADPVSTVNTSLEAFVATFALLDPVFRSPSAVASPHLRVEAQRLDPIGFANSSWAGLLDAVMGWSEIMDDGPERG